MMALGTNRRVAQVIAICTLMGALSWGAAPSRAQGDHLRVGSKGFTESVVLGELLRVEAERNGLALEHRKQLGGSRICFEALIRGDIDVYPEYTGTLAYELLGFDSDESPDRKLLQSRLDAHGLVLGRSIGFNNTYAIGVRRAVAERLSLKRISDLAAHPDLRWGVSNEFLQRADGLPGLFAAYGLEPDWVSGMDHDLAYRALVEDSIQVIDLYSTDSDIEYYDLVTLEDDRNYFPRYDAVYLYRADSAETSPSLRESVEAFDGRIDASAMTSMNAAVKSHGRSEARVAADFVGVEIIEANVPSRMQRIGQRTLQHLGLVLTSLTAAILLAIPLGILAANRPRLGEVVLAVTGVLQTLPSLALFVVLIPLFGIGAPPAIAALFLYSLLPIVRNTHAGLTSIPRPLHESALALGLPFWPRLRRIELPLAARSILAGIKTAAVINVGTATLGALIGAGGYGQPILTGIRLDDFSMILEGAVPAAALALAAQFTFDLIERASTPRGLR